MIRKRKGIKEGLKAYVRRSAGEEEGDPATPAFIIRSKSVHFSGIITGFAHGGELNPRRAFALVDTTIYSALP